MPIKSTDLKGRLNVRKKRLEEARKDLRSSIAIRAKETTTQGKKLWSAQVRYDRNEVENKIAALKRIEKLIKGKK